MIYAIYFLTWLGCAEQNAMSAVYINSERVAEVAVNEYSLGKTVPELTIEVSCFNESSESERVSYLRKPGFLNIEKRK